MDDSEDLPPLPTWLLLAVEEMFRAGLPWPVIGERFRIPPKELRALAALDRFDWRARPAPDSPQSPTSWSDAKARLLRDAEELRAVALSGLREERAKAAPSAGALRAFGNMLSQAAVLLARAYGRPWNLSEPEAGSEDEGEQPGVLLLPPEDARLEPVGEFEGAGENPATV